MPFMDGTGPFGEGPMGQRRGPCGGARRASGFGLGRGRGRGAGRGMNSRQGWRGAAVVRDEKADLQQEASLLERQLDRVKQQLSGPVTNEGTPK